MYDFPSAVHLRDILQARLAEGFEQADAAPPPWCGGALVRWYGGVVVCGESVGWCSVVW